MQSYSLEQDGGPGSFAVMVDREVAGRLLACQEHPGLWRVEGQDGRLMGRTGLREQGAEFLAAWFVAGDDDWS